MTDSKYLQLDFLQTIRTVRKSLRLGQKQLSELAGVNYRHYQDIENKQYDIRLSTLRKLSHSLNLDISELTFLSAVDISKFSESSVKEINKYIIDQLKQEFNKNKKSSLALRQELQRCMQVIQSPSPKNASASEGAVIIFDAQYNIDWYNSRAIDLIGKNLAKSNLTSYFITPGSLDKLNHGLDQLESVETPIFSFQLYTRFFTGIKCVRLLIKRHKKPGCYWGMILDLSDAKEDEIATISSLYKN